MALAIASLITRRWAGPRLSLRRRRGSGIAPRHVLLSVAAGSVALWLLRSRHPRAAASALPPPGTVFRPFISEAEVDDEDALDRPIRGQHQAHARREPPILASQVWAVPRYSTTLPLPWVHRAEVAIRLGRAGDLRAIAAEMQRAGQDIEAGLLDNYALLLDRSRSSRERVLAEVTRMLRAATDHRRSATTAPASRRSAPSDPLGAREERASFIPPPPPHPSSVEPRRAPPGAPGNRPVVPMPVLAVGEKRRASR